MSKAEIKELCGEASVAYDAMHLDGLPLGLQRDSLDYYYLSVYPGLRQLPELSPAETPTLPERIGSAYMHFPFCSGLCSFCSYMVKPVGSNGDHQAQIDTYVTTMKTELLQRDGQTDVDLSYIYMGGGTPSLLPVSSLEGLLTFMQGHSMFADNVYGTIELHPEFFGDMERAQAFIDVLKSFRIGRVSLGYQSASPEILAATNRRHDVNFLENAVQFLKANDLMVNLDVIYGLPNLTNEDWAATLFGAIKCDPDSISTYFLFVNKGTAMHANVVRGRVVLPDHRNIQTQHLMAQLILGRSGFHELPNDFYSKPSVDPATFTQGRLPSMGASLPLGAGAYGYYDDTQFFNVFDIQEYKDRVARGESPIWRGRRLNEEENMHRDIMFSLKNSPYIDRRLFADRYGIDPANHFASQIEILENLGLVQRDDGTMRLSLTQKGRLCVEEIACMFEPEWLRELPQASVEAYARDKKLAKHHFAPTYGTLGRKALEV